VALGADDVEPAGLEHALLEIGDLGADRGGLRVALRAFLHAGKIVRDPHVGIAAELDVGTAAGHVGGDGDRAGHAGLRDDIGFLLVEAGVQHGEGLGRLTLAGSSIDRLQRGRVGEVDELVARLLQHLGDQLRALDRGGADQHRLAILLRGLDLADDAADLLLEGAIDLVILVLAGDGNVGRDLDDLELVDLKELVGLGRRRAGHAGELLVQAEIVLEGDRGQRRVLGLDGDVLLGFQRLVQALRIAPARHHAAGELVDDHHFVVADDVVLVAGEQRMRAQRLIDVMDQRDVMGVIEIALFQYSGLAQQFLDMIVARFRQCHGALLLVDLVIGRDEARQNLVDRDIEIRLVVERAGDDQRRAGFVDQDRVDLVDDREMVAALAHLRDVVFHVVAEIVEAELVVRAVGDVAGIGALALLVVEPVHDDADGQAEEVVELGHPLGVAPGEIVVDRDDMDALAFERIEIGRQGRDQRLAFAGLHLGDGALVQHHAADELDVIGPLAEHALGRLAHRGEGRNQEVVELLALGDLLLELLGARLQSLVAQRGDLRLQGVDRGDAGLVALDAAVIRRAEEFLCERAKHVGPFR